MLIVMQLSHGKFIYPFRDFGLHSLGQVNVEKGRKCYTIHKICIQRIKVIKY